MSKSCSIFANKISFYLLNTQPQITCTCRWFYRRDLTQFNFPKTYQHIFFVIPIFPCASCVDSSSSS